MLEGMTDLEAALRSAVRGEVGFDTTSRALTTMDASNYRRVPLGVVAPRDADDVAAALEVCREHGVPVVARGGGTSIAGQATGTGVVLDFTRHMNRLVALDPQARTAVVQPGLVLDRLQDAAAPHGLRFGPDPSTHSRCTLGGMIGNNSCGSHSVAWGTTADSVRELSVLTARGRRLRLGQDWSGAPEGLRALVEGDLARLRTGFPDLPRRISGYALDALLPERGADVARSFCGSEGTLGVLTEAVVGLVESPPARALAVLGYADEADAAQAAAGLLPLGPLTVEGMAVDLVPSTEGLPRGGAWLFVETGGDTEAQARARAQAVVRAAEVVDALVVTDPAGQRTLWRIREDASGTATRMPDGSEAWPGWEDCAVPPARLGGYLRDFRALLTAHGLRGTPYGHFGDGCIHVRIDFDLCRRTVWRASAASRRSWRTWWWRTAVRCPGSTGTGRRGRSCCRGCTARGRSPSSSVPRPSGTRTTSSTPASWSARRRSTRTCASPSCRANRWTWSSATRPTAATSRRRCAAAWGSPSAVRRRCRGRA